MHMVGFVISFDIALQGSALLIDLGIPEVDISVGPTYRHILVPVILQTGSQSDLTVQRHIHGAILSLTGELS